MYSFISLSDTVIPFSASVTIPEKIENRTNKAGTEFYERFFYFFIPFKSLSHTIIVFILIFGIYIFFLLFWWMVRKNSDLYEFRYFLQKGYIFFLFLFSQFSHKSPGSWRYSSFHVFSILLFAWNWLVRNTELVCIFNNVCFFAYSDQLACVSCVRSDRGSERMKLRELVMLFGYNWRIRIPLVFPHWLCGGFQSFRP
jgi:hypothetical protein